MLYSIPLGHIIANRGGIGRDSMTTITWVIEARLPASASLSNATPRPWWRSLRLGETGSVWTDSHGGPNDGGGSCPFLGLLLARSTCRIARPVDHPYGASVQRFPDSVADPFMDIRNTYSANQVDGNQPK